MVNSKYGKKVGSTQVFSSDGAAIYVTGIEATPCTVVQVKDQSNDGYKSVKVGFGTVKENFNRRFRKLLLS